MKYIRLLAAALMIISGTWHGILSFQTADNRPMLAFAIVYFITGILLFTANVWGLYLGAILPVTGIVAASIKIGWSNFDATMFTLIVMDFIVITGCILLLITQRKPASNDQSS